MTDILTADQTFERVVLRELLTSKEYFSKAFAILKVDYFTDLRAEIFGLIKTHYKEYREAPSVQDVAIQIKNLQNQERKKLIVEELKGVSYQGSPTSKKAMLDETLKFVKDALYLKALEVGSEGLMTKSDKLKSQAEQILEERAKVSINSDLGLEFQDIDNIWQYYSDDVQGIKTHLSSLNIRIGTGFTPGTLSIIAAASGIGKSLLMTDLISGFVKNGNNVLLVSLEMSSEEVMKRVHANTLNIPIADLAPGKITKEVFISKVNEARVGGLGTFYTKDYPALSFSALQLDALLETYQNEKGLKFDVVFVDYLGIMKSDLVTPSMGLYTNLKSITEEVRSIAVKNLIPIISANQLNRSGVNNLEADNSAVSDSFGAVMTADFLMFLLQTDEMKAQGDIIAKITKNRFSGKTEYFSLKVDYQYMRFLDVDVPTTLEGRMEYFNTHTHNIQQTQKQFDDIEKTDRSLAAKIDAKVKASGAQNIDCVGWDDLLADL